jgi:hypothetical protein
MRRRFGLWSPGLALFPAPRTKHAAAQPDRRRNGPVARAERADPLRRRQEFLLAIAAELESEQGAGADIGPGLIHRVASRLQHRFGPAPQPMAGKYTP